MLYQLHQHLLFISLYYNAQVGNYISALHLTFHGNCNMHQIMTQQRQNLTISAMNSSSGQILNIINTIKNDSDLDQNRLGVTWESWWLHSLLEGSKGTREPIVGRNCSCCIIKYFYLHSSMQVELILLSFVVCVTTQRHSENTSLSMEFCLANKPHTPMKFWIFHPNGYLFYRSSSLQKHIKIESIIKKYHEKLDGISSKQAKET